MFLSSRLELVFDFNVSAPKSKWLARATWARCPSTICDTRVHAKLSRNNQHERDTNDGGNNNNNNNNNGSGIIFAQKFCCYIILYDGIILRHGLTIPTVVVTMVLT